MNEAQQPRGYIGKYAAYPPAHAGHALQYGGFSEGCTASCKGLQRSRQRHSPDALSQKLQQKLSLHQVTRPWYSLLRARLHIQTDNADYLLSPVVVDEQAIIWCCASASRAVGGNTYRHMRGSTRNKSQPHIAGNSESHVVLNPRLGLTTRLCINLPEPIRLAIQLA